VKEFSCGELVPGCWATFQAESDDEVLQQVAVHARDQHGMEEEFADGMILDDYIGLVGLSTGGAVRASLGLATNFRDVYRFMSFATELRDVTDVPMDLPPRLAW
jgi:predicted small metal-binding protein